MFKTGRTSTHNKQWEGHPLDLINDETVNIVRTLLETDKSLMLDDLFHKLLTEYTYVTCSCSSIHIILWDQLEMRKVSARWVSRQLTEIHLNQHHTAALTFLTV